MHTSGNSHKLTHISEILVHWYHENKRDLPWRHTKDPYHIWISEVILQQTRIAQGLDYYLRFIRQFPDIKALASAGADDILKAWQGLGYYSRARNLQSAAKEIMSRFNGCFPGNYDDIISLKGIGEYTASAILSIVWNQPYPVVDGNVFRVLSRLFAIDTAIDTTKGKREFTELAGMIIDRQQPGNYNQAIMEFGAIQCTPQAPKCGSCPLSGQCSAFREGNVNAYPVKSGKTKTRSRYFNYLYIIYNNETFLRRRNGSDILTGLYEFPLIETKEAISFRELIQTEAFRNLLEGSGGIYLEKAIENVKHVLSHQKLLANFYRIRINDKPEALNQYIQAGISEVKQYAIPTLIHKYLDELNS